MSVELGGPEEVQVATINAAIALCELDIERKKNAIVLNSGEGEAVSAAWGLLARLLTPENDDASGDIGG